jgi:hypothetical protein
MAAHGEKTWPSVGSFSGRPWGGSHGRRQWDRSLTPFMHFLPVLSQCEHRSGVPGRLEPLHLGHRTCLVCLAHLWQCIHLSPS